MRLNKGFNHWIAYGATALFALLIFVTCEKEADKPTGDNKVMLTLTTVGNPGYFSVNVNCSFVKASGQTITDHGFCYATTPNPDINAFVKNLGKHSGSSDFSAAISNLEDNKKYYIRAFATIAGGTLYAEQKEITTLKSGKPRISTAVLSGITPFSAVCGGVIESDSGYAITASGICWDADDQFDEIQCLGKAINVSGNLAFSLSFTGLNEGTTYYIKAFASNQKGTSYGEIRSFLSDTVTIPTVSTDMVTNMTSNSVICGGNVINNGFTTVFARGVCWDTTENPTLQNCLGFTSDGQGIGLFTSYIKNLSPSTAYYVKAYATNSKGTSYGNQRNFTTTPSWSCGEVISINHTAGSIAPVAKSVNYGTVQTNLSGSSKCWITQNLGADRQAISATDDTEASAGWYWQFNRRQGFKHDGMVRTPNTAWISSIIENSEWIQGNDPCKLLLGNEWRLPTRTEWESVNLSGGWTNYFNTYASDLKMHTAGYLYYLDGVIGNHGYSGYYWSSAQRDDEHGWYLDFNNSHSYVGETKKAFGFPARCLRD